MAIIRGRSCSGCQLSHHDGQKLQCRANPPTVTAILGQDRNGQPMLVGDVTLYPTVQSNDYGCDRWRQKIMVAADLGEAKTLGAA